MSPLTGDERSEVAEELRHDARCVPANAPGKEKAQRLRELADKLEAEPEGYDYESAAAERGEALEAIIAACDELMRHGGIPTALATAVGRACEVMEGVQPSPLLRERDEAREALRELVGACEAYAAGDRTGLLGNQMVRARSVLVDVERTQALVPVANCKKAAELYRWFAGRLDGGSVDQALANESPTRSKRRRVVNTWRSGQHEHNL